MNVFELRQYTLRPGRRDDLIELFDREFVETQEAVGIRVIGQFRDVDDPDRFVWIRAFEDMESRRRALEAFYGGPVWAAHRDAANATMIDSSDVLLLKPGRAFEDLPPRPSGPVEDSLITATIYSDVDDPGPDDTALAYFRTEHAENTFPRLPVRTGEDVVVTFHAGEPPPLDRPSQVLRLQPTARSALR